MARLNMQYHCPLGSSDHSVLTFDFHCYIKTQSASHTPKLNYNRGDYNKIRNSLQHDWSHLVNNDVESSYNLFLEEYNKLVHKHIPPAKKADNTAKRKLPFGSHVKSQIRIRQRRWT